MNAMGLIDEPLTSRIELGQAILNSAIEKVHRLGLVAKLTRNGTGAYILRPDNIQIEDRKPKAKWREAHPSEVYSTTV